MSNFIEELQELKIASQKQTEASSVLAEEVIEKLSDIDKKVNKLTGDVVSVINSVMVKSIHVSPSGSDDNDGISAPLLTIDKALSLIPEGARGSIYLLSAPAEHDNYIYDINKWYDIGSRNVLFMGHKGGRATLRFLSGGGLETRSGGSVKFSCPYDLTIEIVESRVESTLIGVFGGDVQIGGFYGVTIINKSPHLKALTRTSFHVGDGKVGIAVGRVSISRTSTIGSTETGFAIADVEYGGTVILSPYSVVLTGDCVLYPAGLAVMRIDTGNSYILGTK